MEATSDRRRNRPYRSQRPERPTTELVLGMLAQFDTLNYEDSRYLIQAIVDRDVHDLGDPQESAWLRDPDHLDLWHDQLVQAMRKVDHQLTASKAEQIANHAEMRLTNPKKYQDYVAFRADWRARVMRVRAKIEERMAECRRMRRQRAQLPEAMRRLYEAIEHHRDQAEHADEVDHSVDSNLWQLLDDDEIKAALRRIGVA